MTATPMPSPEPATDARARIAGIDIARAVALMGMVMVHFGPERAEGWAGSLYSFPWGRASLLFAVVAGMGMALLTRRPEARTAARLRMAWFAVVLLPFGLALQTLDQPVAVILHHYAIFFLFGALICGLSRLNLLVVALSAIILGPVLYQIGRMEAPGLFGRDSVEWGDPALAVIQALLTDGPYPLLTWAGPIAFGMFLGRLDLRSVRNRWLMVGLGIGIALMTSPLSGLGYDLFGQPDTRADWQTLFSGAPHSQMPLWLIDSTAVATAIIGGALIAGDKFPRASAPVAVLGRFVLSAYVIHVLLLAGWRDAIQSEAPGTAFATVLAFLALATLGAMIWTRLVSQRGPVEWLMHAPWDWLTARYGPLRQSHPKGDAGISRETMEG